MAEQLTIRFVAVLSMVWCSFCASKVCGQTDDWMTRPSTYTHDPVSGQRVDQYALPVQPFVKYQADFQRSGMRHYRSTLQAGQTSDNVHIVEQWGQQVVPYEQWRFPYRPFGVPYDLWGPQLPYGVIAPGFPPGIFPPGGGWGGQYPGGQYPGGYPPAGNPSGGYPPVSPQPGTMPPIGSHPGGVGQPHYHHPGYPQYGPPSAAYPGYLPNYPLTPTYRGEPWYDGNYPEAPPLRAR